VPSDSESVAAYLEVPGSGVTADSPTSIPFVGGHLPGAECTCCRQLPTTLPSAARHLAGRRILVVDDTHDCAQSLAILLEISGHEVRVAHGALEAIEIAERFRPAIIFMDIGLPVVDGFEAIRRIRAQAWGRDIAICTLTGFDGSDYIRRSRELGVKHHLVKPTDFQTLTQVLAATA
jgi:CheY-like chemotaxis protein